MSVQILVGDALETLRTLPSCSVQCCVTSPPYYGLRDYQVEGQIGLEASPDAYVARLVEVFREVRRVLRDDGTLWLNIGDSYSAKAGSTRGWGIESDGYARKGRAARARSSFVGGGIKPKDMIGIPWMLAFALRADGWWLRSEIIWHKPNPMPEAVTDRPTSAHEKVFLLTRAANYFYDGDAIAEPVSPNTHARLSQSVQEQIGSARANGGSRAGRPMKAVGRKFDPANGNKNNPSFDAAMAIMPSERNARNVWTIGSRPFVGAHFATMPPELAERCIKAGSRVGDMVLDPFGGSGTTGLAADRLGRSATLIELKAEYAAMARARLPLFATVDEGAPAA